MREAIAKLLILNPDNKILVLQLGVHKYKPQRSHAPDLPGGVVDPGESEREGAIREAQEEAGVILVPNDVTLAWSETKYYPDEQKSVSKLLYVVQLKATPDVTLSWEHEAYEWLTVDELLAKQAFTSAYRDAILYLKNNQLI